MDNGLVAPEAYANPTTPYYIDDQPETVLQEPILVSAVTLRSFDGFGAGTLSAGGRSGGAPYPYTGAINLSPGASSLGAAADGLTIRAIATGAQVEVGTNSQAANVLAIAGPSGLGQVYDEVYNQPVALQAVTMVTTNPNLTPANPSEILRGTQTAVAAAIATPGSQFNIFRVPRTGAYTIQTEVSIGNATAVNTVVIPSTLVGGVPIWKSISLGFQVQGTVNAIPYANVEVIGSEYYGDQAFGNQSSITKTFTSVAFLTAGVNYAVTLGAESGWNIGDAGQIKTQLIAMC